MNDITCPNCGEKIEITQALKHEFEEKVRTEEKAKAKEEIAKIKLRTQAELEKKLREEFENKNKSSKLEIEKALKKQKELEEKLLDQKKQREEFEKKVIQDALKKAEEEQRLKLKEKDLQLDEIRRVNEDLKRKLEQGSQQRQGEVLELDLEEKLKKVFPNDEFIPVPKGIEGADIWQKVKNKFGNEAGSILWETKRTKQWSNSWLPKLREDARKANATIPVLVSEVLPEDVKFFKKIDGVLITSYEYAVGIADMIRDRLLQVAIAKSKASNDEKLQAIYEYISSDAFRHKFESHFESVNELRKGLESEKRAMERIWKHREAQIERLDRSASQMFGEFQGVIPSLKPLKNLELGSGDEEEQKTLL